MQQSNSESQLVSSTQNSLAPRQGQNPNDWEVIGETFEAMGKVGLAMTVGFTVAAAFCKLVDSGKVRLPKASTLIQLVTAEEQDSKATGA